MKRYYLAYGSNLNVEQMFYRCPTAKPVGTALIKDYELLFRGSKTGSYLTIGEKKGAVVPVAVWEVQPSDEYKLDCYEGYPRFYYKKDMEIAYKLIDNGKYKNVDAFVYIMHEDRPIGVPSSFYMEVCLEGYESFGFDDKYLWEAYQKCKTRA